MSGLWRGYSRGEAAHVDLYGMWILEKRIKERTKELTPS
jgi:hypothetical protein